MTLKEKLMNDMKQAMKDKNTELRDTIRLVNSLIKNEEIKLKTELPDEEVMKMISRELKQTKESLEAFQNANNTEKVTDLENRINILMSYMPKQLSEKEIKDIVSSIINNNGFEGKKDKGKLMKLLMPQVKGKADGKLINNIVEESL